MSSSLSSTSIFRLGYSSKTWDQICSEKYTQEITKFNYFYFWLLKNYFMFLRFFIIKFFMYTVNGFFYLDYLFLKAYHFYKKKLKFWNYRSILSYYRKKVKDRRRKKKKYEELFNRRVRSNFKKGVGLYKTLKFYYSRKLVSFKKLFF